MRIAVIAPPWLPIPPLGYGGTESVIDNLANGLDTAGHDVLLYATGDSTCRVETRFARGRHAGTEARTPDAELHHVVNAYQAVTAWRPDVVHDHTLTGPLYGERFDVPIVTTNHQLFNDERAAVYRAVGDRVSIVAISHDHASRARAAGVPIAAVIHHGINVDAFPVGHGNGDYALFLGRINPEKGVDTAIAAARRAGVPLRIAAKVKDRLEREYFEETIRPLLGDGVEFLGEAGPERKLEVLGEARCLLNPIAWDEPFGLVMIEAMACGTPVVGTPRGSVPELIVDGVTGFVRDTEAGLAQALADVRDLDRERCRKEAAERFSTERMVDDYLSVYAQAV